MCLLPPGVGEVVLAVIGLTYTLSTHGGCLCCIGASCQPYGVDTLLNSQTDSSMQHKLATEALFLLLLLHSHSHYSSILHYTIPWRRRSSIRCTTWRSSSIVRESADTVYKSCTSPSQHCALVLLHSS